MPTFLTTPKMSPALAARILASVHGDARAKSDGRPSGAKRMATSLARVLLVVLLVFAVRSFVTFRSRESRELEEARASLANDVHAHAAGLTEPEKNLVERLRPWLFSASSGYAGDVVSDELRASGLAPRLLRPSIYVRGPIAAFGDPKTLAETAAASGKDPLLVCLLDPPKSRDEKAVLEKVRGVYMGSADSRTPQVRHLHEAILGLPLLAPAWTAKIESAKALPEIFRLRHELEKAPVEGAKMAAKAETLIYAMDEPGHGTGPVEIDGERAHDVRVGIVDIASGRVLFRAKRPVDPAWISSTARVVYARGLDGCLLAVDLLAAVSSGR